MKYILFSLLSLLVLACGSEHPTGKVHKPLNPVGKVDTTNFVPVSRAIVKISNTEEYAYHKVMRSCNPIAIAHAATTTTNVTYTSSGTGQITIDATNLIANEVDDTLELGSFTVTQLKTNKLKICGVGGDEQCTVAVIRIYTQDLVGFTGISGIVNTTDSYGVPVYAGKSNPLDNVGLSSSNAAILQSYTIQASDRRISLSDFPTPTYLLESDFSNAGSGNYEMTLVIELALGI